MKEWKELKVDNLPSDILVGDYEFEWSARGQRNKANCFKDIPGRKLLINNLGEEMLYYYRKPEPKAPTHEEIMTLWWKTVNGAWSKVAIFDPTDDDGEFYYLADSIEIWVTVGWFIGRESADIPPEVISNDK